MFVLEEWEEPVRPDEERSALVCVVSREWDRLEHIAPSLLV